MSLRRDLLPTIDGLRYIPVDLEFRTVVVKRLILAWDGSNVGAGTESVRDSLTIKPAPKVRVSPMDQNQLVVTGITPKNGPRGYTPEQLNPRTLSETQSCVYELTGPQGVTRHCLVDINTTRAFGYTLTLERLDRSPPGSV